MVAYNTEVIIFFVAGVVSFVSIYEGTTYDWLNLAYCYVIIHLVRFTVVFFFYPFLRHSGYNLKVKEALIIVYGGLRGAVGLALALIAAGQLDDLVGENIMFITSGIVVLTMVINGTTTGMIYAKLRPFHPLVSRNEKTGKQESLRQELVTMGFNKIRHQVTKFGLIHKLRSVVMTQKATVSTVVCVPVAAADGRHHATAASTGPPRWPHRRRAPPRIQTTKISVTTFTVTPDEVGDEEDDRGVHLQRPPRVHALKNRPDGVQG